MHHVRPSALSVTQATELGTVYGLEELSALTAAAKRHGLHVHMDGARFANALVRLGCTPAEATWKRGVDVLSLGASKNGALCAEAVVFFDRSLAEGLRAAAQASGPSVVEAALSELPAARLSRGRPVAAQRGAGECDGHAARSRSGGYRCRASAAERRGERGVRGAAGEADRAAREGGFSFLSLAAHAKSPKARRSGSSPRTPPRKPTWRTFCGRSASSREVGKAQSVSRRPRV